ncbi:MAG: protein YciF [Polaromonas sp.]|nr:protein YciF [Polaromonas sp.]
MIIKTMNDLFIHELSDLYNAEKQLTKAVPKVARSAEHTELSNLFKSGVEDTQIQLERIDRIIDVYEIKLKRVKCAAMEGLVEETREAIDAVEKGPVRDAALVAQVQKMNHYQMASCGTLATFADHLGFSEAAELLRQTLEEQKLSDKRLTEFAEQKINTEAEQQST